MQNEWHILYSRRIVSLCLKSSTNKSNLILGSKAQGASKNRSNCHILF